MQTLYRAVKKEDFKKDAVYSTLLTRRLPGNLPYVIDNIWEYLRPDKFPDRRHSAFGNPSPEQALESALIGGGSAEEYVVCEIEFLSGRVKLAHIKAEDASKHDDSRKLRKGIFQLIHGTSDKGFSNLSASQKLPYASLFLPGLSKKEMGEILHATPQMQAIKRFVESKSTFWEQDIADSPQPHNGELFFEMLDEGQYRLKEIKHPFVFTPRKKALAVALIQSVVTAGALYFLRGNRHPNRR